MRSRLSHLLLAGLLPVLLAACGQDGRAAPAVPGRGGAEVADPMLEALELRLFRYASTPPLEPVQVIDQSTYRQDVERRGEIPDARVGADYVLAWELLGLNPGDHTAAKGSPVIVATARGPRIIVAGDSGMVYSVTPDGTLAWSAYTHQSRSLRGIHGTPTIADGVVYIGAYDGALYAFALDSGALIFRTPIGGSIGSSPLVHEGKVYVSVETPKPSGIMAILDARSGAILWRDDDLRDHPHSSVALDPQRKVMVVGDNAGDLTAWDIEPARRRWVFRAQGAIKGPILIHDGAAIFGSWDRHVYAVDLASGAARWQFATGNRVMSGAAYSAATDLIYIGSHDMRLYALRPADGSVAWSFLAGARVVSSPVVAGDRVLFGSHDNHLYMLDAADGSLVYRFRARGEVSSSPALLGDRIILTDRRTETEPGSLYALAPAESTP